jgi:hypothetical protein
MSLPLTALLLLTAADAPHPSTDWLHDGKYGLFMHFLPGDAHGLSLVEQFDVEALAKPIEDVGAAWFCLTLGQNSGYFNSPNAAYDRVTGYQAGQRCAKRDLPLALSEALAPRHIRLMLYLPCQTPNGDRRAQKAFGLPPKPGDQPLSPEFADKWAEVIAEWSQRYGERVNGWWFDGGYQHIGFNEAIAGTYTKAVRRGNPNALVSYNPGVKVIRWTQAEDYTAGELNEPFDQIPSGRWLDGSQWQALTFLGSHWSARDTRYPAERWAAWVKAVAAGGGAVTIDVGPNWDPKAGAIGSLAAAQVEQLKVVRAAVRG